LPPTDIVAAKRASSERKRRAVLDALAAMQADGSTISFRGVARRAGVSHWLVYQEPLRGLVEDARQADDGRPPDSDDDAQLALMAAQLKDLLDRNAVLERRLTEAVAPTVSEPGEVELLRDRLVNMRVERDALAKKVSTLTDELAAARQALREVMKTSNRST
jgi:hypothetical protein